MDPAQYELEIAQSTFIIRVASAVAFCILYYDWVLTLSAEVDRFWKRRLSWVSFGYHLNRGLALLGHIPVIYEFYFLHIRSTCSKLQMYHQILAGVMPVVVGALQIARVYALYECSQRVLIGLVGMAVVCCAFCGWAITQTWKTHDTAQVFKAGIVDVNPIMCDLRVSSNQGPYLALIWSTILICDIVFFFMTLYRFLIVRQRWGGGLHAILLRDGSIYFGILLLCNSTNIFTCLLAPSACRGISVTISNVIATTLIARLMLNLRKPNLVAYSYKCEQDSTTF